MLSQKLTSLNIHVAPENIITTVGATHALDIVSLRFGSIEDSAMRFQRAPAAVASSEPQELVA